MNSQYWRSQYGTDSSYTDSGYTDSSHYEGSDNCTGGAIHYMCTKQVCRFLKVLLSYDKTPKRFKEALTKITQVPPEWKQYDDKGKTIAASRDSSLCTTTSAAPHAVASAANRLPSILQFNG